MASKKRYEIEIELVRCYTIPIMAESLAEAGARAEKNWTAKDIEESGEAVDYETNVVGVTRQKERKMYS